AITLVKFHRANDADLLNIWELKVRVIPFPDFFTVTSIGFCYIDANCLSALIICHLAQHL
ncbi:MAG: hypothetical protein ABN485_17115, partial [Pantoea agglomerans]